MDDIEKNNEKTEKEQGLGELLRSGREKKGLTQEDMARAIRVRSHFIDALENEDWENLPSPVFVKGFIRSYAKALDLDLSEVLAIYEEVGPKKEEAPHPLTTTEKPKKNLLIFVILLIGVAIILIYLWISYPKVAEIAPETPIPMNSEEKVPEGITGSSGRDEQAAGQEDDLFINEEKSSSQEEEVIAETKDSPVEEDGTDIPTDIREEEHLNVEPEVSPTDERTAESGIDEVDAESEIDEMDAESETDILITPEPDTSNHEEPEKSPVVKPSDETTAISEPVPEEVLPASENDQSTFPLTLTGIVSMRTYVKIYVDDNQPKEYIFSPGSRPQWEAREGFNVIIGNAAGIIFNFNGNLVQDLGKPGKVVRLNLPEDFRSRLYEE